jgi:hypothetical protein
MAVKSPKRRAVLFWRGCSSSPWRRGRARPPCAPPSWRRSLSAMTSSTGSRTFPPPSAFPQSSCSRPTPPRSSTGLFPVTPPWPPCCYFNSPFRISSRASRCSLGPSTSSVLQVSLPSCSRLRSEPPASRYFPRGARG